MDFDRDVPPIQLRRDGRWIEEPEQRAADRARARETLLMWLGAIVAIVALAVALTWGQR